MRLDRSSPGILLHQLYCWELWLSQTLFCFCSLFYYDSRTMPSTTSTFPCSHSSTQSQLLYCGTTHTITMNVLSLKARTLATTVSATNALPLVSKHKQSETIANAYLPKLRLLTRTSGFLHISLAIQPSTQIQVALATRF